MKRLDSGEIAAGFSGRPRQGRLSVPAATLLLSFPVILFGCAAPRAVSQSSQDRAVHDAVTRRTGKEFERAYFCNPRLGAWPGIEETFAPLIMRQVVDEGDGSNAGRSDEVREVYARTQAVTIEGVSYEQVVYVWQYLLKDKDTGLPWQGLRITLGRDGFPLVWEVLNSRFDAAILFVSESAEDRARETFGPPLSRRRFAIERSSEDTPQTIVAGVLPDGPIPMGPYAYIEAKTHEIVTVLCRCSPSQVSEVVESLSYDLRPIEALQEPSLPPVVEQSNLAKQLRWPPGM